MVYDLTYFDADTGTSYNTLFGKTGLTTVEREELARLRKENRELRMEREILKKAAAFFAKDQH